jgi:hypothetical protein
MDEESRQERVISAELNLYFIVILPDVAERVARLKDFCLMYEIRERKSKVEEHGAAC